VIRSFAGCEFFKSAAGATNAGASADSGENAGSAGNVQAEARRAWRNRKEAGRREEGQETGAPQINRYKNFLYLFLQCKK